MLAYAAFTIRDHPRHASRCRADCAGSSALGISGRAEHREIEQLRCERGAAIARKAGFDEAVAGAILDLHEHWDGSGDPRGLRARRSTPSPGSSPPARASTSSSDPGRARARVRVMAERVGTWYDPDIADALLDACARGRLDELAAPDLVGRTMALEPGGAPASDDADIDRIAARLRRHRRRQEPVHRHALAARRRHRRGSRRADGHAGADVVNVRRAGLLHDLGKLGVPNMVLDKPARLDASEMEVIRRHPELTLRILDTIPTFADVAELAACHHERLDGTRLLPRHDRARAGARRTDRRRRRRLRGDDRRPPLSGGDAGRRALGIMRESAGDHLAADVIEALADTVA